MHGSSTKSEAIKLRLKGMSYNEISYELKVAKSTLHVWLSRLQLPDSAQKRIQLRVRAGALRGLIKRNKMQTHLASARAHSNRMKGRKMIASLSQKDLLILGAALYWGEGYKKAISYRGRRRTYHPVSLSNSDPKLVQIFLRFLRECFSIKDQDIQIGLRIYEHMNTEEAMRFWQRETKLPSSNFLKVYYGVSISSERRRGFNRLPHGTVQIRVNSTPLFYQIMGLIDSISASL